MESITKNKKIKALEGAFFTLVKLRQVAIPQRAIPEEPVEKEDPRVMAEISHLEKIIEAQKFALEEKQYELKLNKAHLEAKQAKHSISLKVPDQNLELEHKRHKVVISKAA